jgi:hypothetical protein
MRRSKKIKTEGVYKMNGGKRLRRKMLLEKWRK